MSVTITKFLRNVLYADILFSSVGAVLMTAGSPFLSPLLDLPAGLLLGAGAALVPWVIGLAVVARREQVSKTVMVDIIGINFLWAAICFGLLIGGWIAPNALGIAFVVAQAITVALLGCLQWRGMQVQASGTKIPAASS
ncbi:MULTISPECIES: hypothetical protein [unclassified Mesorhizobium]|nr:MULTISPECIES: hypothetical protein [unclassified Mesorhizobium]KQZ12985.1 hypothetical protein ASD27_02045 [Mesorhizobium sp. Root1471]KQZ35504.1 hypothetical protein ASD44_02040 [Mesorhizobium sp. Root554]MDR7031749.1 hypothetical protein [Mesorhizobium sp. BE184]